jgi:hypothetical protein
VLTVTLFTLFSLFSAKYSRFFETSKARVPREFNKSLTFFFNRCKNNPMKLNEIKAIEAIKAEALSNIKGGGRDTRNDTQQSISPLSIITPK